jgi:hypothetical protein
MKLFLASLATAMLAGCAGMSAGDTSAENGGAYLRGPDYFNDSRPWTPRTAVPTQRTFNPQDPYHGF